MPPVDDAEPEIRPFHLHLVSDATGETVHSVARACMAQFASIEPIEHHWSLVRTTNQIERILANIADNPGIVMFTVVNDKLRQALQEGCGRLQIPCIPILDPVIATVSAFLGLKSRGQPGGQHVMNAEYFDRIDAMTFAMTHDDGQSTWTLKNADVILVGVSRTSKTPTCMYLANRGIKAANVPVVPGVPLPDGLEGIDREPGGPLVVGLTNDPERLIQIRKNRLRLLTERNEADYVDPDTVREEVVTAKRLCIENNWPIIDVTRRSIEETAAAILQLMAKRQPQAAG